MWISRIIFTFSLIAFFAAGVSTSTPVAAAIPIIGPACAKLLGAATFFASPVMKQKLKASRPVVFTSSSTLGDSQASNDIEFFARSGTQFWVKFNGNTFLVEQKTIEGASSYVYKIKYSAEGPTLRDRLRANLRYPITGLIPGKTIPSSELPELAAALEKAAEPGAPMEGVTATNLHEGLIFNLSNVPGRRNYLYGPWLTAARAALLSSAIYTAIATPLVFNFTMPSYFHPNVVSPLDYVWSARPNLQIINRFKNEIERTQEARNFAFMVRWVEEGDTLYFQDKRDPWTYYVTNDDGSKKWLNYPDAPGGNEGPWITQSYSDAKLALDRALEFQNFLKDTVRVKYFLLSLDALTPEFRNQYWANHYSRTQKPALFLPNSLLAQILPSEASRWQNDHHSQVPIEFIHSIISNVEFADEAYEWKRIESDLVKSDKFKMFLTSPEQDHPEEYSWRRFFYATRFPDPVYNQTEVAQLIPPADLPIEKWSPQVYEALIDLEKRASLDPHLVSQLIEFHDRVLKQYPSKAATYEYARAYFLSYHYPALIAVLTKFPSPEVAELLRRDLLTFRGTREMIDDSTKFRIRGFFAKYYGRFGYPELLIDDSLLDSLSEGSNGHPELLRETVEAARHVTSLRESLLRGAGELLNLDRNTAVLIELWTAPETTDTERIFLVNKLSLATPEQKKTVADLLSELRALAPAGASPELLTEIDKAIQNLSTAISTDASAP